MKTKFYSFLLAAVLTSLVLMNCYTIGVLRPSNQPIPANIFVINREHDYHTSTGKAFILEHVLFTARHIVDDDTQEDCDVLNELDIYTFGYSEVKGLSLCEEEHICDDMVFFRLVEYTNTPYNVGKITAVSQTEYTIAFDSGLCYGDSGSPVECIAHNKVVGMVYAYYVDNNEGYINRIYKSDITRELNKYIR